MEVRKAMKVYLFDALYYFAKMKKIVFYLIFSLLLMPSIAFAYVDPGSVSILLQVILAFFLGGLLTFKKKIIEMIKSLYRIIAFRK